MFVVVVSFVLSIPDRPIGSFYLLVIEPELDIALFGGPTSSGGRLFLACSLGLLVAVSTAEPAEATSHGGHQDYHGEHYEDRPERPVGVGPGHGRRLHWDVIGVHHERLFGGGWLLLGRDWLLLQL